ncbi:hypothetical protein [Phyllobacterium bourgognense]|uniref:Uncharacterized protein n=1 Tax=Phyllobacterium bourgognense TaxID=314236 RepID=A0A368Z7E8_9HYPH|nr:hypothetical protein [Phyllobacterium bourgognense]RCW87708.1 hypothetical protein C7476_101476 [Phyllobacterium bourgognense]
MSLATLAIWPTLGRSLAIVFCTVLWPLAVATAQDVEAESDWEAIWKKTTAFQQSIQEAETRGDHRAAVSYARECHELWVSIGRFSSPYCTYYYVNALAFEGAVCGDQDRAFRIVAKIVSMNFDDTFSIELTRFYLDGIGTFRNTVEATVTLWRFRNGKISEAFSCKNGCDDLWHDVKALETRLEKELSREEKAKARTLERERFPRLYYEVLFWNILFLSTKYSFIVLIYLLAFKILRSIFSAIRSFF